MSEFFYDVPGFFLEAYPQLSILRFPKTAYNTLMTNTKTITTLITISFLLIIGIVLRYTQAADVSTSAEIQNTTPTVDTIRFATTAYAADNLTSTGILPSVGTTRTIHINGTINDANGEADIASSTLNLVLQKKNRNKHLYRRPKRLLQNHYLYHRLHPRK